MKKWIACLSAVALMLTMLPISVAAQQTEFGIFHGTEELRVSIYGYIPLMYEGDESIVAEDITWTSDNEQVLAVYEGYAEARAVGTAVLTATTADGLTDSVKVTVYSAVNWNGFGTQLVYLSSMYPTCTFRLNIADGGYYRITTNGDADAYVDILDADGGYIDGGNDENNRHVIKMQYLEAGTYYLYVGVYDAVPRVFNMTVEKMTEEELDAVVEFEQDEITLNCYDLYVPRFVISPAVQVEEIYMWSSDERILMVEDGGLVLGVSPGKATLTIQVGSYTDTMNVAVDFPKNLVEDKPTEVSFADDSPTETICFTAASSGTFVFRSASIESGDPYAMLMDGDGNVIAESNDDGFSKNFEIITECEAGKTYRLFAATYTGGKAAYQITVGKLVRATSMTLGVDKDSYLWKSGDTYYVPLGTNGDLQFEFGTAFGAKVYDASVKVSDDAVVEVQNNKTFIAKETGTVTVSATGDSTLKDTMTIVVIDLKMGDITLDGTVNMVDVIGLYNRSSGKAVETVEHGMAMGDLTGDNTINMLDVMRLYNAVSGQ